MHRLRDESYSEDLLELHEESRKAADVVEVVRCKDCGHWWGYTNRIHTNTDSREWDYCQKNKKMKPEDGFCHEGELRA